MDLSQESGDAHISDLVRRCREIEASRVKQKGEDIVEEPLHTVRSTEEQEEVEK